MIDALKALHGASAILGMLPEHPGYNGAVLLIDDEEAARCVAEIDAAAAELSALRAERDELRYALGRAEVELTNVLASINADMVHFDGDEFHDTLAAARAALKGE